jgi:capsular polysaccharide biosynthesis protein/Mrp family chromosome partitioning ATPase
LPVLKRWWWLLAVGAGVAGVMGLIVASRLPDTYEANARLLVGPLNATDGDVISASGRLAQSYAEIATTASILEPVASTIGLTPDALERKITDVTASEVTRFVTINVRDGDRVRAALIANELALQLLRQSRQEALPVDPAAEPATEAGAIRVVERATVPEDTIGPSTQVIVFLAAFAGLLCALGLAVLGDSLSGVVRSEDELVGLAPVAFLGSIDGSRTERSLPLVLGAQPESDSATEYRLLAAKIELSNGTRALRSVLVLDAHGGRSSGSIAANLAGALAEGSSRVALLDTDEEDSIVPRLGLDQESADGNEAADEARPVRRGRPLRVERVRFDRFRIPRSGLTIVRPRARIEPLDFDVAEKVLERLLNENDLVVVSAPSFDRSSTALVWSRAVDATVLAVQRDRTKREQIPGAVESLHRAGANVIGTVLCRERLF